MFSSIFNGILVLLPVSLGKVVSDISAPSEDSSAGSRVPSPNQDPLNLSYISSCESKLGQKCVSLVLGDW